MSEPKPKALRCRDCGGRAEAWLRAAVVAQSVVVFPAKWIQSNICTPCEDRAMALQEAALNERLTRERLERAGLGDARLARLEFKNYRTDCPARERVARLVRPIYSAMAASGRVKNVLMSGAAGTGKTHLAVSFARAALARNLKARFWQWSELMLHLREVNLGSRLMAEVSALTSHDVLVLDDLGAEKPTEFVVETLYLIVDRWWRMDKAGLLVTTNLPIHRLSEVYGDRISSRLGGMATLVDFEGCPDGRIENLRLEDRP